MLFHQTAEYCGYAIAILVWWIQLTVIFEACSRIDVRRCTDLVIGGLEKYRMEGATLLVALLYHYFTWNCRPPDLSTEDLVYKRRHYRMRRCWYRNYMLRRRFANRTSEKPPPYFSEERLPPYEEATKEVVLHTLARDVHRILHLPSPLLDGFVRSLDDPTGTIAALGHDFLLMRGSIGTASNVSEIELERLEKSVARLRNWEQALQRSDTGGIMHRLWVTVMAHGYETSSRPPAESGYFNSPVVLDTGASSGLTPYRCDFISYRKVNIPLRDVSKINHVIGVGTVAWRFKDKHGHVKIVHCQAYYLTTADIRLFSPQNYYQQEYNKAKKGEGFGIIGTWDLTLTFAEG
jgi:hypothetical protein